MNILHTVVVTQGQKYVRFVPAGQIKSFIEMKHLLVDFKHFGHEVCKEDAGRDFLLALCPELFIHSLFAKL